MEPAKKCKKCGHILPLDRFYGGVKTKDGLMGACKSCQHKWRREHDRKLRLGEIKIKFKRKWGTTKVCTCCGVEKEKTYENFSYREDLQDVKGICRECFNIKQKLRKRKITFDEYKILLKSQDYRCKICDKKLIKARDIHFDHNHVTGENRGILCPQCNKGMGFFGDNIQWLHKAIEYLRYYESSG